MLKADRNDELQAKMDAIFAEMGFSDALAGTAYLKEMAAWYKPGCKFMWLYAKVAQVSGVTPQVVERCARWALHSTWARGGYGLRKRFGAWPVPPCVSALVAQVAREVRR